MTSNLDLHSCLLERVQDSNPNVYILQLHMGEKKNISEEHQNQDHLLIAIPLKETLFLDGVVGVSGPATPKKQKRPLALFVLKYW